MRHDDDYEHPAQRLRLRFRPGLLSFYAALIVGSALWQHFVLLPEYSK